jgi:hypothetical protein
MPLTEYQAEPRGAQAVNHVVDQRGDFELLDDGHRRAVDDLAHRRRVAVDGDAPSMVELRQLGLMNAGSDAGDPLTLPLMRDWLIARAARSG